MEKTSGTKLFIKDKILQHESVIEIQSKCCKWFESQTSTS